jgi:hypothetical protein
LQADIEEGLAPEEAGRKERAIARHQQGDKIHLVQRLAMRVDEEVVAADDPGPWMPVERLHRRLEGVRQEMALGRTDGDIVASALPQDGK